MEHLSRVAQQRLRWSLLCSSCLRHHGSRRFHTSIFRRSPFTDEFQAQPLGDFYTDLLTTPISRPSTTHPDLPTFVQSGDETKEQRAAKLFGSIRGSGYERKTYDKPDSTWRTINGVPIPPRPSEPDNCCMSGCVHCVWDDYRDDVESWATRLHEAQANSQRRGMERRPKAGMHRIEVADASNSMDDDGGGSEALWDSPSTTGTGDDLFQDIPIGIREFMVTEKRIRDRKRERKERRTA